MGFYRVTILSSALSHVIKCLIEPNNIVEINASRIWNIEDSRKIASRDIPYLYKREYKKKSVFLNKELSDNFVNVKAIVKWLNDEGVQDLAIDNFGIMTKSDVLKEFLEKIYHAKIPDNTFYIKFAKNPDIRSIDYFKKRVAENMRYQIDNLDFKTESLDLVGIWLKQDCKEKSENKNILNKINGDKRTLTLFVNEILKEFIKIRGQQVKIRAIKYYDIDSKNIIVLKNVEVI